MASRKYAIDTQHAEETSDTLPQRTLNKSCKHRQVKWCCFWENPAYNTTWTSTKSKHFQLLHSKIYRLTILYIHDIWSAIYYDGYRVANSSDEHIHVCLSFTLNHISSLVNKVIMIFVMSVKWNVSYTCTCIPSTFSWITILYFPLNRKANCRS